MAALAKGLRPLWCPRQLQISRPQWHQHTWRQPASLCLRTLNTTTTTTTIEADDAVDSNALLEAARIPFKGITHARTVPATPSYFSREPRFNDLYIRISKLLTRFNHLPTVTSSEAPLVPWTKLDEMRAQMGEPIKASHYAHVLRVAKRLNLIEPSLRPAEVKIAIKEFSRDINPLLNKPNPIPVDKFGRAVGAGKRKASTARAFVVEGTGEVLVNGKPLNQAFGRVHDRESAVWALTATGRLDKYNVWALVEGGGTTGQAEAITLAVAKALLAHEPALKTALRRAGCITRDARTVERKKHGHVKARKMPAWVKR
ncbi:37S ribosomal protein S9, mitochondrial [Claviceps africana]|uniref:Small ribosomal subunit protein uS9m n=1 Tax=Claviceps africana TaxID=83212 RepID=A0A8K0JAN0_9HYPO|nr:37S ribosomal protein S9, mitochondrial [Claviceps africana]